MAAVLAAVAPAPQSGPAVRLGDAAQLGEDVPADEDAEDTAAVAHIQSLLEEASIAAVSSRSDSCTDTQLGHPVHALRLDQHSQSLAIA